MNEPILYGFETHNNVKVRVALGLKGIPYHFRAIDPADRTSMLVLSGQYLTPVLKHGDVVLSDSAAILRYLDANFSGPRLYGTSMLEQLKIDEWELFARTRLAWPMLEIVQSRGRGGPVDITAEARCARAFGEVCTELVAQLAGREWLVGGSMSAADVTAAPLLDRVRASGLLPWPAIASELSDWIGRVMAFDGRSRLD